MTTEQFNSDALTDEQREAMRGLQDTSPYDWEDFLAMSDPPTDLCPYVSVHNFCGMFVGIEPDGYTHT